MALLGAPYIYDISSLRVKVTGFLLQFSDPCTTYTNPFTTGMRSAGALYCYTQSHPPSEILAHKNKSS